MMRQDRFENSATRTPRRPVMIAIAVATFGLVGMLVVDHGPWSKPQVHTAEMANHRTTGESARAVGATVTPTPPSRGLEPETPGPKPIHPANPGER